MKTDGTTNSHPARNGGGLLRSATWGRLTALAIFVAGWSLTPNGPALQDRPGVSRALTQPHSGKAIVFQSRAKPSRSWSFFAHVERQISRLNPFSLSEHEEKTSSSADSETLAKTRPEPSASEKEHSDHPGLDNSAEGSSSLEAAQDLQVAPADSGDEEDGLSLETKKRMREVFALNAAEGMRKLKNPVRLDIEGDNVDVLRFELPSMNEGLANDLIRDLGRGDANFWNGIRLMNFSQIIFSGNSFKKIVSSKEIISRSQDYDKYKKAFLEALKRLQTRANTGETT